MSNNIGSVFDSYNALSQLQKGCSHVILRQANMTFQLVGVCTTHNLAVLMADTLNADNGDSPSYFVVERVGNNIYRLGKKVGSLSEAINW